MSYSESRRQVCDHVIWNKELLGVRRSDPSPVGRMHVCVSASVSDGGGEPYHQIVSASPSKIFPKQWTHFSVSLSRAQKWNLLALHYYGHVALALGTEAFCSYLFSLVFLLLSNLTSPFHYQAHPQLPWAWNPPHYSLWPLDPVVYPKLLSPHCSFQEKRSPGSQTNAPAWRALSHYALWGLIFAYFKLISLIPSFSNWWVTDQ